jgi:hypothetical protein
VIKKITIFFLGLMLLIPINGLAATESAISVDMHYLVVSPAEDGLTNLVNMVNYSNTTAETFKGDGTSDAVLNVNLPKGAIELDFLENKIAAKQVDTGFITTDPVPANSIITVPFSYQMAQGEDIVLTIDYPVQIMQILVPEGMGSIEFKDIEATNQGLFKMDGKNYQGYNIEAIEAGKTFTMVYDKDK